MPGIDAGEEVSGRDSMKSEGRIPDSAIVVRGGQNRPEDILRGTGTHPSGVSGISVECADAITIADLSALIPHRQIGQTTVGAVRVVAMFCEHLDEVRITQRLLALHRY